MRVLWVAAMMLTALVGQSCAEDASLARATQLSDRYNECVYFSAVERINKNNGDISAAAEEAFPSCATEARQMTTFMRKAGATDTQIADMFAEKNAGIKSELRKMSNEARGIK